ncbi:MAG: hypothetical protein LHW56_11060, partial [Candidatus Cloacimonetes bacterium]|nr:hypothetical protein [Candidatus Cloacimonadota bacterium]MDY0173432.1 hypothetical protein [Candidatus Cloacimonadaceae bacterium]
IELLVEKLAINKVIQGVKKARTGRQTVHELVVAILASEIATSPVSACAYQTHPSPKAPEGAHPAQAAEYPAPPPEKEMH